LLLGFHESVKNAAFALSDLSPKTEVCESSIHGRGLFARESVSVGEIVAVKGGYILNKQARTTLEKSLGSAEIQITEDLFIAPVEAGQREGSMVCTNHSCDPNIAIQGQIVFVAMKNISSGEELTHDWATTDDLDYAIKCTCGSPNCRGTITGKDWMRKELQKKYKGWFSWFLQQKIEAHEN
jgi:uncharacterized protein